MVATAIRNNPRDDVDRQRKYGDRGEHEVALAGVLTKPGRNFLLRQLDPILEPVQVPDGNRELFA